MASRKTRKVKPESVETVRFWPVLSPIPDGWVFDSFLGEYHGQYSILIRKL